MRKGQIQTENEKEMLWSSQQKASAVGQNNDVQDQM